MDADMLSLLLVCLLIRAKGAIQCSNAVVPLVLFYCRVTRRSQVGQIQR